MSLRATCMKPVGVMELTSALLPCAVGHHSAPDISSCHGHVMHCMLDHSQTEEDAQHLHLHDVWRRILQADQDCCKNEGGASGRLRGWSHPSID